jgi:hypothetical protein
MWTPSGRGLAAFPQLAEKSNIYGIVCLKGKSCLYIIPEGSSPMRLRIGRRHGKTREKGESIFEVFLWTYYLMIG